MPIQNQQREVIRQNFFRMDNVVRVSSYLLKESCYALQADDLWRRTFVNNSDILRTAALFHHQKLELDVGEKFTSTLDVVGLDAGKEDWQRERFATIDLQPDEVVVSRCIWIRQLSALELGREVDLIAFCKAYNSVKPLPQPGIVPGQDVEQFVADSLCSSGWLLPMSAS